MVLIKILDPFGQFSDDAIWNSLRQVELADFISSTEKKLDYFLEERGQNFSVGQKQLICLARALLQRNKILVIDEATANVDPRLGSIIFLLHRSHADDKFEMSVTDTVISVIMSGLNVKDFS